MLANYIFPPLLISTKAENVQNIMQARLYQKPDLLILSAGKKSYVVAKSSLGSLTLIIS
jgi:hypothetical protein